MIQKSNIRIKQLQADDWRLLKKVRLQALTKFPNYFSPSQDESSFNASDWKNRLNNANTASFALFDDKKIIGITGIIKENLDPNSCVGLLVSSYIHPDYQGQGLSKLFYQARIAWAKNNGLKQLKIEHHKDNSACKKAHQKFGFQFLTSTQYKDANGKSHISDIYCLFLEKP